MDAERASLSGVLTKEEFMPPARAVKGMVSVAGRSYRIVRVEAGHYAVIRILDDLQVGSFRTAPRLSVLAEHIEPRLLDAVARAAIQLAKTSWVGHARPGRANEPERRNTPSQPINGVTVSSTEPPPPSGVSR